MRRLSGLILAAGVVTLAFGCGGGNEKATFPDKIIEKPSGPPSAAGGPVTPKKEKDGAAGGGSTTQ